MLSVRNMLTESQQKQQPMEPNVNTTTRTPVTFNEQLHEKKPSVLNISSLLCSGGIPELPIQLPKPAHFHQLPPPPPPLLQQQQAYHYHSSIQQQPQREKSVEIEGHEEDAYVQKLWARQTRLNQPSFHQQQSIPHSYYLLNKHQRRSSRQHQIESQKIEQELLHDRRKSSSSSSSTTSSLIYSLSTAKSKTKHYSLANKEEEDEEEEDEEEEELPLKAKRRRASSKQLDVLNKVFERTFFPSTQLRAELGRQLGMSPRTVQIWFQNRRQAIRTKERTGSVTSNSSRENSISLE